MPNYPTLLLRSGRERSVLNKHPWVYSGALQDIPSHLKNGDIVQIADHRRQLLGLGHYNVDASIACRMFHFGDKPIVIDEAFWRAKFDQALQYRRQIGLSQNSSDGYRLFYSEGDGLPGLICDVFGDVAALHIKTQGMLEIRPLIVAFLQQSLHIKHVFHKTEGSGEQAGWLLGEKADIVFVEHNLKFHVDVLGGQKTGYFLDQRDNRHLIGTYAKDKRVLDAFSYSGGFSVFALSGEAKSVTSIDASEEANALCRQTVASNFGKDARHTSITADCFDYLRNMEPNQFDLMVLDPPAFSKNAATVDRAARGYKDINLLALRKIAPGGILFTFSCSQHISRDLFRKIIFGAAKDAGRSVRIMHQLNQAPDHPVDIYHPEGEYLKGLVVYVE